MTQSIAWDVSVFVIPLFLSIILHEIAHGWAAALCGDTTAKRMGRLTLNPIAHIDPVGSILLPALLLITRSGFMFGWAKPVPVNFQALNDEKKDMGLVALAGPLMNFVLALCATLVMVLCWGNKIAPSSMFSLWMYDTLRAFISVNIGLCAFNLFPLLPLDGGRIVVSILPKALSEKYAQTERYGIVILLIIIFVLPNLGLDILHPYVLWIAQGLVDIIKFIV